MNRLVIRNRQRIRAVDLRLFRRIARTLAMKLILLKEYELGVHLVAAPEMARINEAFLNHKGSTDVITFDYSDSSPGTVNGEMLICLDDAVAQAKRFRTSWQSELVRYLVHGVLHLRGYDDLVPTARRKMKLEEDRLLGLLAQALPIDRLAMSRSRAAIPKSQIGNSRRRLSLSQRECKLGVRP